MTDSIAVTETESVRKQTRARRKALMDLLFEVNDDGYEACLMGAKKDENPYGRCGGDTETKLLREAWDEGYENCMEDYDND